MIFFYDSTILVFFWNVDLLESSGKNTKKNNFNEIIQKKNVNNFLIDLKNTRNQNHFEWTLIYLENNTHILKWNLNFFELFEIKKQ
mgnify:CR=1 FL=1